MISQHRIFILRTLAILSSALLAQMATTESAQKKPANEKATVVEAPAVPEISCSSILRSLAMRIERRDVVEAAQEMFPGGVRIGKVDVGAVDETQRALLGSGLVVYDAAFQLPGGPIVRAAILKREATTQPWDVFDVSPSITVHDRSNDYVSALLFSMKAAGIITGKTFLISVNRKHRRGKSEQPLFMTQEVSIPVEFKLSSSQEVPEQDVSAEGEEIAEQFPPLSVMDIPWFQMATKRRLMEKGVNDFAALLARHNETELRLKISDDRLQMLSAVIATGRWVDSVGIKTELRKWDLNHPLVYLDFETISPVLPRYENTAPSERIPFQFSVRVGGSKPVDYLHESNSDPRLDLILALLNAIPEHGSVVAFNKSFESSVLLSLADAYPEYSERLRQIAARLVDPSLIFKKYMYDVKQRGSYSLKALGPALFGEEASYKGLQIGDGLQAGLAYERLISSVLQADERAQIRSAMLEYCSKDTEQLRLLVDWLFNVSGLQKIE
jgi:hypothetical protein